jgi:two-component sensor histidine kinase
MSAISIIGRFFDRNHADGGTNRLMERPFFRYFIAIGAFSLSLGIRFQFADILPTGLPLITFMPAIILVAYFAGPGPACLTAILSGIAGWRFFVASHGEVDSERAVFIGLFFYIAFVVAALGTIQMLRQTALTLERERSKNASLADHRAFLYRELQHRVANNMAFLSAILSMQKSASRQQSRDIDSILDDAIRRIRLFSNIHRRLHDPDSENQSLDEHFRSLFDDLVNASGAENISLQINTNGLRLPGEALTTLSLLAVELMTNAIKHAFIGRTEGTLTLWLGPEGQEIILIVSDDGIGKAEGCGLEPGLGYTIIEALCEQLGASRKTHIHNGMHVEVRIPALN